MPARRPEIRDITYDEHDVAAGFRCRTWGRRLESERLRLNVGRPDATSSAARARRFTPPASAQWRPSSTPAACKPTRRLSCGTNASASAGVGWLSLESAPRPPKRHIDQVGAGKERRGGALLRSGQSGAQSVCLPCVRSGWLRCGTVSPRATATALVILDNTMPVGKRIDAS